MPEMEDSSDMNGPKTPVANSRKELLRKNSRIPHPSRAPPAHPNRLVASRRGRDSLDSSVYPPPLSSDTGMEEDSTIEIDRRQPNSPGGDFLAKLSNSLAHVRTLKRDLSDREAQMAALKGEKEKYEMEHGKIYSQMVSLRSKLHMFESQLAKKTQDYADLLKISESASEEVNKLRALQAEENSKQTIRIKALEGQVSQWKRQAENIPTPSKRSSSQATVDTALGKENAELKEMVKVLKERVTLFEEESKSRNELTAKFEDLNGRLEETRVSMLRLSTEKVMLQQENQKLKTLLKQSEDVDELRERLSLLETERSNAKTALKKAMTIIDQEEILQAKLDGKDIYIKDLETRISVLTDAVSTMNEHEPRYIRTSANLPEQMVKLQEVKSRLQSILNESK